MQLHQPRLAELVAATLRKRIVTGELASGSELPRQDDLMAEFGIGRPAVREALRILESEGLVTVRRGNRGGAVVHAPQLRNAAYSVGLVLEAQGVMMGDLREAITSIEPICAGLCAAREDRAETLLPVLWEAQERARAVVDDDYQFTEASRRFHELLIKHCGNRTLILVMGALEALWSERQLAWARTASASGGFPGRAERADGLRAHERLLEQIEAGDVDRVQQQARRHLDASLLYALEERAEQVVSAARSRF